MAPSSQELEPPANPGRFSSAYLAVVIDLYSRRVVSWSMQSRQTTDVVLQALLMAVWRRKPKYKVLVHSDSQRMVASSRAV